MPSTYNDIYIELRNALRSNNIASYNLEARVIICSASGKTNTEYLRDMALYATPKIEAKAKDMLERRLCGEPVAYITNSWEFYGLPFYITPDVLIPRMDTEVVVDAAVEILRYMGKFDARILDLCCGSGCIGCAIANEFPASRIVEIDLSARALEVCRKNVELNHMTPRTMFIQTDAKSMPPMGIGTFDLIVCNPPYIPSDMIPKLDASVRDYEPVWALDGGTDGLDFYRKIIKNWKRLLRNGGYMIFEIGEGQDEILKKLFLTNGYHNVEYRQDTLNTNRVVMARI
jgi:release factor glutamine methyltransferase